MASSVYFWAAVKVRWIAVPPYSECNPSMRLLLTAIAFFISFTVSTAQYSAKATVDSTHLMIGDQLRMHLDVVHPPGAELLPMVLKKKEGDVVEFLGQSKWDTISQSGNVRLRKDLLLTVWDSGYHDVPALPIVFLANAKRDTIFTLNIPLEVEVPPADSVLADIKPIIEEPTVWQDYIPEMAVVAIAILVALLWFIASRIKTHKALPPPPPVIIPPQEIALRKLKELREQKLWQKGQVKEFHSQLTYIIREYLEKRYGVQALEQTTDEILAQMKGINLGDDLTPKMTRLLQTADLVKFAKAKPPADYHDSALALGEEFVRATKEVILPTSENENAK